MVILGGTYAVLGAATHHGQPAPGVLVSVFVGYLIGAQLISAIFGTFSVVAVVSFAIHIGIGIALWLTTHLEQLYLWLLLLTGLDAYYFSINLAKFEGLKKLGGAYIRANTLRRQNEKLRLRAVEADLQLARRLKESCAPSEDVMRIGRCDIRCTYQSSATISGDWLGVRALADQSCIVAIASVNGSGIPAAMMVQSLQALWVTAPFSEFSPLAWLRLVHATLIRLSGRQAQSLRLGLVHIREQHFDYYAIGNSSLFMVEDLGHRQALQPLVATGEQLGTAADAQIFGQSWPIPEKRDCSLLLTQALPAQVAAFSPTDMTQPGTLLARLGSSIVVRISAGIGDETSPRSDGEGVAA
jgi:hypothetical protein